MPKFKIICFVVAAIMAAVGTMLVLKNLNNDFVPPDKVVSTDMNTYLDRTEDMDISDRTRDAREFLFVAHKILLQRPAFKGVSSGTSTAMGGIEQSVLNTRVVLGEFGNKRVFKEMVTKGIVSNAYQLYLVGLGETGNYIYRGFDRVREIDNVEWSGQAQPLSMQAFYNRFGHRSDKLTSYILNWDTVTDGEFVEEKDGLYTFLYNLDTETAPADLRYEMVTNGNLADFPKFTKCRIYVTMDADFNIRSLRTDCAYQATTMGINAPCAEDITEVIEDYEGDLPYTDFFSAYLGQVGGNDIQSDPTALNMLMDMFAPYLGGEELRAYMTVTKEGEAVTDALISLSGLDISDLSKLTVDMRLGELNVCYKHGEGKILVNWQDFNGSATVDGIMQLVEAFSSLGEPQALSESAMPEIDLGALLEGLTFSTEGNICTVDLPVSLEQLIGVDMQVNARFTGVLQGDKYVFDHADISINDTDIHISLREWTPTVIDGNAPEILGLADLIVNGKLALSADVELPLSDRTYRVQANVLADLGNGSVSADAILGNNGSAHIVYADNIAYLALGNVKVRLDVDDTDDLLTLIGQFAGDGLTGGALPQVDVVEILALLGGFRAEGDGSNITLSLSTDELTVGLDIVSELGRWNVRSVTVRGMGIEAQLTPSDMQGEVTVPADGDEYADITEMVAQFDGPILGLAVANGYALNANVDLLSDGTGYHLAAQAYIDEEGSVSVSASVDNGNVKLLCADAVYAKDALYLQLNGIKVALPISGSDGDVDMSAALDRLAADEQVRQLLADSGIVKIVALVRQLAEFDPTTLLDVDFAALITDFGYADGVLSLAADGSALGLEGVSIACSLYVRDGGLALDIDRLTFADMTLSGDVAVAPYNRTIALPDAKEYVTALYAELMGAQAYITADLLNDDIWASVHIGNEDILLRYTAGKVYLVYGGARIAIDTKELDTLTEKIEQLTGTVDTAMPDMTQLLAVFAALSADFTGEPNISLVYGDIDLRVNFTERDGALLFEEVCVTFAIEGETYEARLTQSDRQADKLSTAGEFVNGNVLAEQLMDTVLTLKDAEAVQLTIENARLTVGGSVYSADVTLNTNGGTALTLSLRDGTTRKALVYADIRILDGVAYIDFNGIRQALDLTEILPSGQTDMPEAAAVIAVLYELRGMNGVLDSILDAVDRLPRDLDGITFSQIIEHVTQTQNGISVRLDPSQFALDGVTLDIGLGVAPTIGVDGFTLGEVSVSFEAALDCSTEPVTEPEGDYGTVLSVSYGEMSGAVMLDLYGKSVYGQLDITDKDTVLFEYEGGNVYLQYGNVNVVCGTKDIGLLLAAVSKFVTLPELPQTDGTDILQTVKEVFSQMGYTRTDTEEGYMLTVRYGDMSVYVRFRCDGDRVSADSIEILPDGTQTIALRFGEADIARLDTQARFDDITRIVDTFAQPVADILNANSYGAHFDISLDAGGEYYAEGDFTLDAQGNISVAALVKDGDIDILDIALTRMGESVYLTVNGISVRFRMQGTEGADVSGIAQLLEDERIQAVLSEHPSIAALIDRIQTVADKLAHTDIATIAFAKLIDSFEFDDGTDTLTVGVDASDLSLGRFTLRLCNDDGNLVLSLSDLELADIRLREAEVTLMTNVADVTVPGEAQDYILKLNISGFGANIDLAADLYNMDIWAQIHYTHEEIQGITIDEYASVLFSDNILYVDLNNIHLKFRTSGLMDAVTRIMALAGASGSVNVADIDVNDILSRLDYEIVGGNPLLTYESNGLTLAVRFGRDEQGRLAFAGVTGDIGGEKIEITPQQSAVTEQPSTEGTYTDGNDMLDTVSNVLNILDVKALAAGTKGIDTNFDLSLSLDGRAYTAALRVQYFEGLKVWLTLYDGSAEEGKLIAQGSVTFKAGVLYIDVNGIRQAVDLRSQGEHAGEGATSVQGGEKKFSLDQLSGALEQYRHMHGVIDAVIDLVQGLPERLRSIDTVSSLIVGLTADDGKVTLALNGPAIGLKRNVAVTVGVQDGKATYSIGDIALPSVTPTAKATYALFATLSGSICATSEAVKVEGSAEDYITDLSLDLTQSAPVMTMAYGESVQQVLHAGIRLDLYHGLIHATVSYGGNQVTLEVDISEGIADGVVYVLVGKDISSGTKMKFDLADTDSLMQALAQMGIELPETSGNGGSVSDTASKLLGGIRYERAVQGGKDVGYTLALNIEGISVGVGFRAESDGLTLDDLSLYGGNFLLSKASTDYDVTELNAADNAQAYSFDAAEVLEAFAPSIGSLLAPEGGYTLQLNGVTLGLLRQGNSYYKVDGSVTIAEGNIHIKLTAHSGSDKYNFAGNALLSDVEVWLYEDALYIDLGGIRVRVPMNNSDEQQSDTDIDSVLNALKGYSDSIDAVVTLIENILATDLHTLNVTDMLGLKYADGTLTANVDGSRWGINEFSLNAQPLDKGISITLGDLESDNTLYLGGNITVTGDGSVDKPIGNDWATDLDITIDDHGDMSNKVHVRVDLTDKKVYAEIESPSATDTARLYVKYDIPTNTLWVTDKNKVNASVNIDSVSRLVDEVQKIVVQVSGDENEKLPDLIGGGLDLKAIKDSLEITHDTARGTLGASLTAMGFGVTVEIANGAITAKVNVGSIFPETALHVGRAQASQKGMAEDLDEYIGKYDKQDSSRKFVSLDTILNYWFYKNGEVSEDPEDNGVIYDLVNTNAWMFAFDGDVQGDNSTELTLNGTTYRIGQGSFLSFYFDKAETSFSMETLIDEFGQKDKTQAYNDLFILLNSLQLRAKLNIYKGTTDASGNMTFSECMLLDVALLRDTASKEADKNTSRLYVSYDTSSNSSRPGTLRATLSVDTLKNVIQLKDELDKVLGGAITGMVNSITKMIADMQQNAAELRIGKLARLFNEVSYGGEDRTGTNLVLRLNGSVLGGDIGEIGLDVQPYNSADASIGNGLQVNALQFSYGDISLDLRNVTVTASPFTSTGDGDTADARKYTYVDSRIDSYRTDNRAGAATGSASDMTASGYDRANDHGSDMTNFINLDSLYELASSVIITASNYGAKTPAGTTPARVDEGYRSFRIEGDLTISLHLLGRDIQLSNIHLTMYADIDKDGESYFAVKIHRDEDNIPLVEAFADKGGDSYLTFDTVSKTFSVYRDSILSRKICPGCGLSIYHVVKEKRNGDWRAVEYGYCDNPECKDRNSYKLSAWASADKLGSEATGMPDFHDTGITPAEFMSNLMSGTADARCPRGYLFEMINLGSLLGQKIEKIIMDQIGKQDSKVFGVDYGVEDILDSGDSYNYGDAVDNSNKPVTDHKQFQVKANLKPISSALGTLDIKIHHSGDFKQLMQYQDGKWVYDESKLAEIKLDRLCGGLNIVTSTGLTIIQIDFDLTHTTPGYGTAAYYVQNNADMWNLSIPYWTNNCGINGQIEKQA